VNKIFYTKPSITQKEIYYVNEAVKNGWGDKCYECIFQFEEKFKKYLGVKYAIATSSCTGALHMGLHAIGIRRDDEVILGDINWIACAAPITYLGAKPVVVDVKQDSWCIDPKKIEEAIIEKTKAIIAVHLYGNLCDIDELLKLGQKYNIPIIEDSAEAIGSIYNGKKTGSMGKFGVFSFHGTKTITTGEGGMFVTNDDDLYEKVLTLSNHGRSKTQTKQFWPDVIGFKYKMSNIQAAIGCAQMDRIDELIEKKRQIFKWYEKRLKDLPITMNPEPENCQNSYWMPTIVVNEGIDFNRDDLLNEFKANNIDGRVFFYPLSVVIEDDFIKRNLTLVACSLYHRAVNLPSYHDLKEEDIDRVVECVNNTIKW
jgi:perosamine synthetase